MPVILTPNMSLPVPVVGQEPGPQYATDVNSSLNIIDGHNHTPGYGVPVPSAGINYNADISAFNNRLTLLKSATFTPQGSPLAGVTPDIGALYVSGVDLYYNDANGVQIRITQSGSVTGTPGSITGLTPPASASYSSSSSTFIWQSAVNTAAGMDNGPITIREEVINAKGITIQSPTGLAADYSLTLPGALPVSESFMASDSSGNLSFIGPDNVTTDISGSNQLETMIRSTGNPASINGVAVSPGSGAFNSPSGQALVTSLTITTRGGPVYLTGVPDAGSAMSWIGVQASAGTATISAQFQIDRNNVQLANFNVIESKVSSGYSNGDFLHVPPASISTIDFPPAGTHIYELYGSPSTSGMIAVALNFVLIAYEL